MLSQHFSNDYEYEIGMDEAGRGPLFGRLYVAGAVLPKGNDFHHEWMKDSKKFHSKKKNKRNVGLYQRTCISVVNSIYRL